MFGEVQLAFQHYDDDGGPHGIHPAKAEKV
jgi:hypothetical protein